MKIKDIERTANVAWSPKDHPSILLAAGTAAQQLDASFNTNAALEVYSLNLNEIGPDCLLKSSISSEQRFHRLIWGPIGVGDNGTIIGGCDGGLIKIYSATKLLNNENCLLNQPCKHQGPVHALDFNPFQQNLFATGAGESEIFIWDMNNTNTPMSPGAKTQPLEDVLSVSWNRQVQHILASTFASKCVIWDLRKNEPIIKLTDTVSRVRWKMVAWHPEVATQLCLASEEDHSPIIQLWDLRFATSPLKTFENHQRGILSIAWCIEDSDLLISCGKDNRILAWNPNSITPTTTQTTTTTTNNEFLGEIAHTNQWNFDIQWCPRNPAIIACPNFDGHISIYSLMGGKVQQIQTTNKIADSFPGMDGYTQTLLQQQQQQQHQQQQQISCDLNRAPKWMKRPIGASFAFGGKLITFDNIKLQPGQNQDNIKRSVNISQVITEPELIRKSIELEQALEYGNFVEYCRNKADSIQDQHRRYIWHFLRANFEDNPRAELLNLLGYRIEDVNNKLNQFIGKKLKNLNNHMSNLTTDDIDPFDNLNSIQPKSTTPFQIKTGDDTEGLITQALLLGNVEAAVELCLEAKRFADAIIIAMTGGSDLLARTQHAYLEQCDGYVSSLISALISEDWASIINNCDLNSWKEALAATLTHSTDETLPQLCEQLGNRLENEYDGDLKLKLDSQLCYICAGSFDKLVNSWCGNIKNSTDDLQDLVELVMFLQKSIERQGKQIQINGKLADLLSYYSSILASQGNLKTALIYLNDSQDEKIQSLRDRLYINLGQKPIYNNLRQQQQQQSRRNSSRNPSFSSNYSTTALPPTTNQFNTGLPNAATPQPWQNQNFNPLPPPQQQQQPVLPPTRTFSPTLPPTTQPPRPSSGSGLPQRKYVLDPSVTSNQYGLPPSRNVFQPSVYNQQQIIPNNPPLIPNFTTQPLINEVGLPAISDKNLPPPPFTNNMITSSIGAPGWNDPPVLNRPIRQQTKQELAPPQPITHPLYGGNNQQLPINNGYNDVIQPNYNQETPPNMFQSPQLSQMNQQNFNQSTNIFNPGSFKSNAITPQPMGGGGLNRNVSQPIEKAPAVVEKPPIPEEHIHMKTVFDELRNQCSCAATNPQLKRKLDDVNRKLEALYDLLREHKLSTQTLTALHQMVQMIQDGNYTGGLNLHTQLVSGPDFAQIASFMPGLKVLLQCALQLQVYIR